MQTLFDLKNRSTVHLLSQQTVWGMTSYTVYDPCTGTVYTLQADEVSFEQPEVLSSLASEADIRYRMLLPWLQNELRGGAVSVTPESVIRFPLRKISPSVASYTPFRIFIRVDFPAPFSPTRACTVPR